MPYTVILKKNEEKNLFSGYGFVYANEVYKIEGKDKNGSLATVRSFDGRFIGKGYINHLSKILVRIFIYNENDDEREVFLSRIKRAKTLRETVIKDDCYRAVYAEADLLPGLIVDRYANVLSVQFLTLGVDQRKDIIIECLKEVYSPRSIVERSDVAIRRKEGLEERKGVIFGEDISSVIVNENGLKMKIDLIDGQKTGYFLDQKKNRFSLRKYVKDKTVLDCFCNAGGFSLNAAVAGAKEVYALDISKTALKEVEENAKLNGIETVTTVEGDVFEKLREYKAEKRKFDVIILDPPAFTKDSSQVKAALKGYKDINILAMKLLRDEGILISSSCSHFVSENQFSKMLSECAKETGKCVQVLERRSQAEDHPVLISADGSAYLKFFVLRVFNA